MPENEEAWCLWRAVQTQWRSGGMGVIGIDYSQVRAWALDLGIEMTPGMWGKIRALEHTTLKSLRPKEGK